MALKEKEHVFGEFAILCILGLQAGTQTGSTTNALIKLTETVYKTQRPNSLIYNEKYNY